MALLVGIKILSVCLLDVLAGDPRWLPHPVRLMGYGINQFERTILRLELSPFSKKGAGTVLALGLPLVCFFVAQGCLDLATHFHHYLGAIVWVVIGYTTLAARDLYDHAMRVFVALCDKRIETARSAVSHLVGRETKHLQEPDIVRATVESVAENASDGVIAPLCFLFLGGPPLAMAYKAINTLDSMVGYRNERYQELGWASARLDDLVNWVPARISALALCGAASLMRGRGMVAWRIGWRDGRNHPSPNSGWPEAVMAGALGVQLGGKNRYGAVSEERPRMGDPVQPLQGAHIPLALQLMGVASLLVMVVGLIGTMWAGI